MSTKPVPFQQSAATLSASCSRFRGGLRLFRLHHILRRTTRTLVSPRLEIAIWVHQRFVVYLSAMLCPHCQAENPTAFGYCQNCRKPLTSVDAPPPPPPTKAASGMHVLALLAVSVVLLATLALGFLLPVNEKGDAAFQAGYRVGRVGVPLLIAFLIAYVVGGRKSSRHPNRFALIFCLIGGFFLLTTLLGSGVFATAFEPPEQRFSRLMREAAGTEPIHESWLPSRRRWDDAIRDQYRDLLSQNREYEAAQQKLTTDARDIHLNSATSFADPEIGARCMKYVGDLYALDISHEDQVRTTMGHLRDAVALGARNPAERDELLKGYDNKLASQMAGRDEVLAKEKVWNDAVQEEYKYAGDHAANFSLVNDRLVVADQTIREEFNRLLEEQRRRRLDFVETQQTFTKHQSETLEKVGLKPKDLHK
jgi:hypothetical protein